MPKFESKFTPESAEQYIRDKADTESAKGMDSLNELSLSLPLPLVKEHGSGEVEFLKRHTGLKIQYTPLEGEYRERLKRAVPRDDLVNAFLVDDFVLSDTETGRVLDLEGILPNDKYKVVVKISGASTQALVKAKMIYTHTCLHSPAGILDLLHEAGHLQFTDPLPKRIKSEYAGMASRVMFEMGEKVDMAHILEQERKAWAFCLRKIKPFLADKEDPDSGLATTEEVRSYIHASSLSSYGSSFVKILEDGLDFV